MTDDEREAVIRERYASPGHERSDIRFLLRRLDEARRRPTLAEIRERHRGALDLGALDIEEIY